MEKVFIQNRKDKKIAVIVEVHRAQKGLAFVMHGLGGFKEQLHIQTVADSFQEHGFTVVRFDTTNTFGESDGHYEDATVTNYYEDLEDVIAWASTEGWYQEPFALAGHSLGGICTALYAERHPEKVALLAPVSPVVSGNLSVEKYRENDPEKFVQWEKTGWKEEESQSEPGRIKRLPWSHMEDRIKYDLLPEAARLTMPVLLIVGEQDTSTPPEHVQILADAVHGPKEFHVIKGAPHTFRSERDLAEVKALFDRWLEATV